jgi:hypothetical protein
MRPDQAPRTNVIRFQGDAYLGNAFHRADTARPPVLAGRIENRDEAFDAPTAKNFFEEASAVTAHGAAPQEKSQEKSRKKSQEKAQQDNASNPFDGFRDTL